ncbi:hypothetical protein SAMN04488112_11840 [Melghirimyces thermohalophilus]|uniref:Uncharacterized protein n=1 Tax=Melghirimyces thermohalophilus TaxID=1236220 RepID=A0A1G6PTY6_9BACL|nr:hypothetical protein SAMN04488112_11840 [Melghirimyces thermohalophilus]
MKRIHLFTSRKDNDAVDERSGPLCGLGMQKPAGTFPPLGFGWGGNSRCPTENLVMIRQGRAKASL